MGFTVYLSNEPVSALLGETHMIHGGSEDKDTAIALCKSAVAEAQKTDPTAFGYVVDTLEGHVKKGAFRHYDSRSEKPAAK